MGYPKDILSFHINLSQNSYARIKLIWKTVIDDECAHEWVKRGRKDLMTMENLSIARVLNQLRNIFVYMYFYIYMLYVYNINFRLQL